ncbi:hypothetical protein JTE90_009630 [Oedothorax gibbosus]|uniref:THAP-type domain-containing protein n=1 Tax=Oedothorax gibbosus TaxID=931172 RepID=A0AAV6VBP5_9ARAC|nr:hypothetical protein JTE90_009630 [Oedothorax gibbosus]
MSCVAFGCYNNSSKKIAGITFHRFPKEEILRKEWAKAVKRDNWNPSKHSMAKRKFEEFDDEDEPRSETSVLFEEMPMGDVSEACLYDDDDDFMGLVTQIFAENPLPLMYGEGVNVGERASPGFWTGLPVNGPISWEHKARRRHRLHYSPNELHSEASVGTNHKNRHIFF